MPRAYTVAEVIGASPESKLEVQLTKAESMGALPGEETQVGDIMCNDGNMELNIIGTETKGGWNSKHVEYQIKGKDSLGEIDVMRRYSEFLLLHDKLFKSYPGLIIPPVPAKKSQGNMDDFFIEERKYFL